MNELAPGTVTVADLYRELTGLRTDVGKALIRLEHVDTVNQAAEQLHSDHEARLRVLESFRWKAAGAAAVAGAAAGGLSAWAAILSARR